MLLFAIVTAVMVPLIVSSWDTITASSTSIAQYQSIQRIQNGQILSLISITSSNVDISLDLINIGIYEIGIDSVLIDGVSASYLLTDQSLVPISTIPLNQIVTLLVTGNDDGDTIQIITISGKLLEYNL